MKPFLKFNVGISNKNQIIKEGAKLEFTYLDLNEYLLELHKKDIHDINILLLISLETNYYEGDSLKRILLDIKKLSDNLVYQFDILDENGKPTGKKTEKIKFKVNKIQIDNGDILNRHRWIYRYNEKYMLDNNLTEEEQIPENIKQEIETRAYETAKQQGIDWFKNHAIDAINEIILNSNNDNDISLKTLDSRLRGNDDCWKNGYCHSRGGGNPEKISNFKKNSTKLIDKDFQLTNGITKIFEGNNELPPIEYICYDYWLNHPDYKKVEKLFNEARLAEKSPIDNAFYNTANDFLNRLMSRNQIQWFPDMFKKYSFIYLVDETIKHALIQGESDNNFELYFGAVPYDLLFKSDEIKNNEAMNHYLKDELLNLTKRGLITIRTKR